MNGDQRKSTQQNKNDLQERQHILPPVDRQEDDEPDTNYSHLEIVEGKMPIFRDDS